ncbi:MAG: hypothetical protein KAT15_15455, partial [Bacteroidales bacterium]|nr:hypothetical protein [Bacteroidales bacterium]
GGEIYIYGNTAVSLPGSEDGWTIFKISSRKQGLSMPLYIFNNSWQVDFDIIGSPGHIWTNNHIRHFNNACYSEQGDSFGIYKLGLDNKFDYDCSNVPFPSLLTGKGFEKNGMVTDPLFLDPYNNDFRLQEQSPCIDRGKQADHLIMEFHGKGPDIGAYDNGELIEGIPFRYMEPAAEVPYQEMPRITRHKQSGNTFKLWFSSPLSEASVLSTSFWIRNGKGIHELGLEGLSEDGYCLSLTLDQQQISDLTEVLVSGWPRGKNGMLCTSWAATIPVRKRFDHAVQKANSTPFFKTLSIFKRDRSGSSITRSAGAPT